MPIRTAAKSWRRLTSCDSRTAASSSSSVSVSSSPASASSSSPLTRWKSSTRTTLQDKVQDLQTRFDWLRGHREYMPIVPDASHAFVWNAVEDLKRANATTTHDEERRAAVLVPLVSCDGMPSLLYTARSEHLSSHASEVSFPGGHFEEDVDSSLEDTAIRETSEELLGDYPFEDIEIIGRGSPLPSIRGTPVTPIVGVLPYEIPSPASSVFPGNPDEVDQVFCVSLQELLDVETSDHSPRFQSSIPSFSTREGHRIWGLTAMFTRPLLHRLFKPVLLPKQKKG